MQRILGIATVILILDQISKWLILAVVMQPPRRIPVTDFFNLVLTYNTGVSFGLFQGDSPLRPYFLSAIALVIVVGLLVWARRQPPGLLTYGVGGVVGGAIGNVIDRMHQPGVVDFLDFHVAGWHWPAFNIADSAIVCGVVLILVDGLFEGRRKGYKEPG